MAKTAGTPFMASTPAFLASTSVSIENAVDVSTINGLLKEVVREEQDLQLDIVEGVAKKEHISHLLGLHQVQ
jgi:hypothetical protein|tara:strand:- start:530 stop:745 length:216 start_codon:yes stop_codon:yes gene_type:complete